MHHRVFLGMTITALACLPAGIARAGNGNEDAGVSLHVSAPLAKANCAIDAPNFKGKGGKGITFKGQPCNQAHGEFTVWVLVCNASDVTGVAGVEFGIEYEGALGSGVDVLSWLSCGDASFPSGGFPAAGGGNLVVWEPTANCQNTNAQTQGNSPVPGSVIAVAGAFQIMVLGSDTMEITPRPVSSKLAIGTCAAFEDDLTNALVSRGGIASFCLNGNVGYNFCAKGALGSAEETTWGKLKSLYRN